MARMTAATAAGTSAARTTSNEQQQQESRRTRSRMPTSKMMACAFIAAAVACLSTTTLVSAQEASSVDADGNTVVYSVGLDAAGAATTVFLETIAAADATAAAPVENTASAVTLGQALSPSTTGSTAPPTTYLVFITNNGVQTSEYHTFTATTPVPTTTIQPAAGTIIQLSSYIPPTSSTSAKGAAASSTNIKLRSANGKVAAVGVLLSMLVGAAALW